MSKSLNEPQSDMEVPITPAFVQLMQIAFAYREIYLSEAKLSRMLFDRSEKNYLERVKETLVTQYGEAMEKIGLAKHDHLLNVFVNLDSICSKALIDQIKGITDPVAQSGMHKHYFFNAWGDNGRGSIRIAS